MSVRRVGWPAWVAAGVVLALVAAGLGAWRWTSADPGLASSCSGVTAPDGVAVERREAGGASEQRIGYRDGATLGLGLCLSADDEVEVLDVRLPVPASSLFRPTVVRASPMADDPDGPGPELRPTVLRPRRDWLRVTIEGELSDCERYREGVGLSFDAAEVTYRYRGRTRTDAIELTEVYTFVAPPDAGCPRPRAD